MAKIRIHKETLIELYQYAVENGFYSALQDYLEECGFFVGELSKGPLNFENHPEVFCRESEIWWYPICDIGDYAVELWHPEGGAKAAGWTATRLPLVNGYYEGEIDDLS